MKNEAIQKICYGIGCVILLVVIFSQCGCKVPSGTIVSMTQSTIGIRIGENPRTQTPEVQVGFFRATYQFVPTSSNEIFAPKVNSSLSMDQKAFSTSIDEDFQTGGAESPAESVAQRGASMRLKLPKADIRFQTTNSVKPTP